MELKRGIFDSQGQDNVFNVAEQCLYGILDNYSHSQMIILTRLLEIISSTGLSPEVAKMLKVIDLIKFPVKKLIE